MPHIAFSANSCWNIWNFRKEVLRSLIDMGHRVSIVAPRDEHTEKLLEMGAEYFEIGIDNKGTNPFADARLVLDYRRAFKVLQPDLFLGVTIKPNIYGGFAARMMKVPAIFNVSGLGTAFIRDSTLTRIVEVLYRQSFARAGTVFFQNEDDRALFLERKLVSNDRAELLPGSGINLDHFDMVNTDRPKNEAPVFVLVARMLWDKGIGEFVTASRIVRERYPKARFQLIGPVDVDNRTAVSQEMVDEWVREGSIEYLGEVGDIRPHIHGADCVVLPSYREGAPRTLLEGAAMGRPLIATDVPGCRQLVAHGTNGYLCEARDTSSLAQMMEKFCGLADEERRAMGRASRDMVENQYDVRFVVERYHDAIAKALPNHAIPFVQSRTKTLNVLRLM